MTIDRLELLAGKAVAALSEKDDALLQRDAREIVQDSALGNQLYETYADTAIKILSSLPEPSEGRSSLVITRKYLWECIFYALRNTALRDKEDQYAQAIRRLPYYHSSAPAAREVMKELEAVVRKHFAEIEIVRLRRLWGMTTVDANPIVIRKAFQSFGARLDPKDLLMPFLWYTK